MAGKLAKKAAQKVEVESLGLTKNPNPFVSRAALKLDYALRKFGLSPKGEVALHVGHRQLHPKLLANERVVNLEGINAKSIPKGLVPSVGFVVYQPSESPVNGLGAREKRGCFCRLN